jgi:hypothetical protein
VDQDGNHRPEVTYTDEFGGRALDTAYVDADQSGYPEAIYSDTVHYGDQDTNPYARG